MILGEIELVKARKNHRCTACEWIDNCLDPEELEQDNPELYKEHKKCGGTIKKGDTYHRYTTKEGGEIYSCKESIACRAICVFTDVWDN